MSQKNTPESIYGMTRGFMNARVVLTGAELDIYTLLDGNPLSADEICQKLDADLRALTVTLDAITALGLLVKEDGKYCTEPSAAAVLSSKSPTTALPGIMHSAHLWETWSQLTATVKGEYKPGDLGKSVLDKSKIKAFIGAMHVGGAAIAEGLIKAINPGEAKNLIDVGGGSGTYTLAFLDASPDMKATIFDLPPVIEMAKERVEGAGMMDRVSFAAGNFYKDDLPAGHDLALISAIIHQNNPDQNTTLYKSVFNALDSGGRIVIRDHVMSPDKTKPTAGAMFAINMLVGTPGGGTYTLEEIGAGLKAAGFNNVKQIQNEGMSSLVEAFKP